MNDDRSIDEIFCTAIEIESSRDRQSWLNQACGDDAELRRQVDRLLEAHFRGGSIVDAPAHALDVTVNQPRPETPGTQIGPYKLLQQIGEGGMGAVFMAEQTQPVQRKVALKLIKPGMDSGQIIARFEAERQALAMMDHVNIARVLDAGTIPIADLGLQNADFKSEISNLKSEISAGRPYFVMELINGVPITKYCDDNHLTPCQRLELFVPVCQAIQHAHQKGIIHRDIKPSNVMVTLYDGKPVPKVIDFGVAKATEQKLTERTLFTQYGTMVGTLEYMSPEQAEMSALGVDTRSDIYSLGVLLYELLTGSTPLTHKRMKEAAFGEILRLIKEEEPPRPSRRLSDSGEALASISAQRQMEPSKLSQLMRGELDWIVMKTLEKDRNRRYETAKDFAADMQRYLNDEQVHACPPSVGYRLRKFARRNKSSLAIIAGCLAFLVVLGGGLGWFLSERSNRRAATASHVEQALAESESLFRDQKLPDAVASAQAAQGLLHSGGDANLRQRAADWLRELSFAARLEEARLLASGINERSRLDYDATAREYAKISQEYGIAVDAPDAAERIRNSPIRDHWIAVIDHWASLPIVKEAMKGQLIAVAVAADDDPWRSQVRSAALRDTTALKRLATEQDVAGQAPSTQILLAVKLHGLGETDAAVNLLQQAQRRYPSDFWVNQNLAHYLLSARGIDDAIRFQTAAVALRPQSPSAHLGLANMLARKGSLDEAMTCFQEGIRRKPEYSYAHFGLGQFLIFPVGDYRAAAAAFSKGLEFDPDNVAGLNGRGGANSQLGEWDKAFADSSRAVVLEPERTAAWYFHGESLSGLGRYQEAVAAFSKAIELLPDYVVAYRRRGQVYAKLGRSDLAATDNATADATAEALGRKTADSPQQSRIIAQQLAKREPMAVEEYTKLIERDKTSPTFWYARGIAYSQIGQCERAVADFSQAIDLKFPGAQVWLRRAEALLKLNRADEAIDDLTQAIELRPDLPEAWQLRGAANAARNRPQLAVADQQMAIELAPGDLILRLNCARAYVGLGMWDRAVAEYSKLMELSPRASYFPLERGQTYHLDGQYDKAIADFTLAIRLEPKSPSPYSERGRCYAELGQWKESAQDFAKAAEISPEMDSYWHFSAVGFLGAGDQESYQAACTSMLARFRATTKPEIANRIVSACVAGPIGKAEADQTVALAEIAAAENSDWSVGLRGAALLRAGNCPAALECFEKKAKHHPPRAWDLLWTSLVHHCLGNRDTSMELRIQAEQWMATAGKFKPRQLRTTDAGWESWQEELEAQVIHAEVVAVQKAPQGTK